MLIQFPYALLGLLLIPLIILLRLWRLKPLTLIVPNLFLWQRIKTSSLEEKTYRRKKFILTLLLQCLACAILILALSGPALVQYLPRGQDVIILLDNSARMKTLSEEGKTRWSLAKEHLTKLLNTLSPQDHIRLCLTAAQTDNIIIQGNPEQIRQKLDSLVTMDVSINWSEYLIRISPLISQTSENALVYLYSDHTPPKEFIESLKTKPVMVLTGSASRNIGITHFSARSRTKKPASSAGRHALLISVSNFTAQIIITPLELYADGKLLHQTKLTLSPGSVLPVILEDLDLNNVSLLEAKLKMQDDFPLDNTAWLARSESGRIKICWLGPGNYAISKALQANPNLQIDYFTDNPVSRRRDDYDLYIYNNLSPQDIQTRQRFVGVVINPPSDFYPIRLRKKISIQSDIIFDSTSPLLKHIRSPEFHIWQARGIKVLSKEKDFFHPIIYTSLPRPDSREEATKIPLLAEWHKGKKHLIILGFDPDWHGPSGDTDWSLSVSFPVFWTNLINYLSDESQAGQDNFRYYQTGIPCRLNLRRLELSGKSDQEIVLRQPDGTEITIQNPGTKRQRSPTPSGNEFTFIPTQVGVYEIGLKDKKIPLAVNLACKEVSNNDGETKIPPIPSHHLKKETKTAEKTFSLIPYLIALGLVLLLLAWWTERQRSPATESDLWESL